MQAPVLMSNELSNLTAFRWENRILLIQSTGDQIHDLKARLDAERAAIDERDILWFLIDGKQLVTNFRGSLSGDFGERIGQQFFEDGPEGTDIVLIGKDGGSKARYAELDLEEIYRLIDSMPMRQAEMRRQR